MNFVKTVRSTGSEVMDLPMVLVVGMLEAVIAHHAGGVLAAVLARVSRITDAEHFAAKHWRAVVGG